MSEQSLQVDSSAVVALNRPDADSAAEVTAAANAISVIDQPSADAAATWRNGVKDWMAKNEKLKELEEKIDEANGLHRYLCSIRNSIVNPRTSAIQIVDGKINIWLREQERRAAMWKQAEDAEKRRQEEDRRLAEAEAARNSGATEEEAEAILEQPIIMPRTEIPKPRAAGFVKRETFKAEVLDKMKLIKAVACVCGKCRCRGNPALLGLLDPAIPALNAMARAQKENLNLPGVRAVADSTGARGRS